MCALIYKTISMATPKVNVISNDLDQAPKTRAAGYGKVVDSMREEMTEAMNGVNIPNIISNESDQAPKTRAAGYEQNVLAPLYDEIDNRMEMLFMKWSELICDYVNKFVNTPENRFICDQIMILEPGDSLSFEIKREKRKSTWWRDQTVWPLVSPLSYDEKLRNFNNNCYWKGEKKLEEWEILTVIVVKKDENDPYLLHIHAEQLEKPRKWAQLPDWAEYFHNSNVSDDEFGRIIS